MQEFQLRVLPLSNNDFALELYQCAYKQAGQKKRPPAQRIGQLKGQPLIRARQAIYQCLKDNNYDPQTLSYRRQKPYVLNEQSGVSMALLFQTLEPLSNPERISSIADGITAMSNEEAHYWFAMVSNGKRRPALKAMRVLLGN
ncbi:DUF7680 family protein [Leptothoe kymatousa]|uniref:DUF7680 domain-containing protein n=1 Tax=Leptothoe kymatousa TAU-MAC 1615 TaxID=2364775 RepID=A0ABS5Y8V7_9CYAN|nr:hypothetical protein [Leptothoe kymatousa]MBT9313799.1 hypothetical protein [Leptothoe kymatousa TAU-MAC 1615]